MKDIDENNWEDCLENFKYIISELYEKNSFLLESKKMTIFIKKILMTFFWKKHLLQNIKTVFQIYVNI